MFLSFRFVIDDGAAGERVARPVLPSAWSGFTATRRFRGATYEITVRNPDHVRGRAACVVVDGNLAIALTGRHTHRLLLNR